MRLDRIKVRVAGEPKGLGDFTPVKVVGLQAVTWWMGERTGSRSAPRRWRPPAARPLSDDRSAETSSGRVCDTTSASWHSRCRPVDSDASASLSECPVPGRGRQSRPREQASDSASASPSRGATERLYGRAAAGHRRMDRRRSRIGVEARTMTRRTVQSPVSRRPLLSVDEVAIELGESRSTIYRALKRGDLPLPAFTINGRLRIPRRAVERLINGVDPATEAREVTTTGYCASCDARPTIPTRKRRTCPGARRSVEGRRVS
jgi:excisionase family DNA binding protein